MSDDGWANVVEVYVDGAWCELASMPQTVDQAIVLAWSKIEHPVHFEVLVVPRSFPLRHVIVTPEGERIPQGSPRARSGNG